MGLIWSAPSRRCSGESSPPQDELQALVERLAERIGRTLERQGLLARDAESSYLELDPAAGGPLDDLIGHSITYRVAVGPRAGQKVFSLQTVPAREEAPRKGVAQYAGFSLHAGIGVAGEQRDKLERLTRYVSRPPVAIERLDLTAQGQVRYRLKTPLLKAARAPAASHWMAAVWPSVKLWERSACSRAAMRTPRASSDTSGSSWPERVSAGARLRRGARLAPACLWPPVILKMCAAGRS